MVGDDLVLYLIIGGLRKNFFGQQIALAVIWTAINDFLAIGVADPSECREFILGGSIDVDQVSLLGFLFRARACLLGGSIFAAAGCCALRVTHVGDHGKGNQETKEA